MRLEYYQITKYNPAFRDEFGRYTRDEWTDYFDIGNTFEDGVLTLEEYLRVEGTYVEALKMMAVFAGVGELVIDELELYPEELAEALGVGGFDNELPRIGVNRPLDLSYVADVARLALREGLWCVLKHPHFEIHFGYEYYVIVGTDLDFGDMFRRVEELGLFVESVVPPAYCTDE